MLMILQDMPPKKGFIRGVSYLTGYWIVPTNVKGNVHEPGCEVIYVTQSDPKGIRIVEKLVF